MWKVSCVRIDNVRLARFCLTNNAPFLCNPNCRTSNSTIAVVLGGCIGEAAAPFVVSLAIANFGPGAFVVCICALIVALVVTYAGLHVYLKYTPVVQYRGSGGNNNLGRSGNGSEVDVEYGEGGKGSGGVHNMLHSGVFGTSNSKNVYHSVNSNDSTEHVAHDAPRHLRPDRAYSEGKHAAAESPRTLMNYSGFSRVSSFGSADGAGCEEGVEVEVEPLVLPSTRYHTVRANGNVSLCHSPGGSGSGDGCGVVAGGGACSGNSSSGRSSPGIAMIPMHAGTSPRVNTSHLNTNASTSSSSTLCSSTTNSTSNLYVKSFRVPLFPDICHPGNGYEPVSSV